MHAPLSTAEPLPRARRRGLPWPLLLAGAAAVGLAGAMALAVVDEGRLLERWLAPLGFLQESLADQAAAARGEAGTDGVEYVIFLRELAPADALVPFFAANPSVRYVSNGLWPGVVVVRVRGDLAAGVTALRAQPSVRLALKSRLGMVCH
jgi:hypothetical protein